MKKILFLLMIVAGTLQHATAQSPDRKMDWWREARFGMFIHFGVYAQFGGLYHGHEQKVKNGEWLMNRMKVPVAEYKDTARSFNPVKFDAEAWVKTAKNAGMKYIVITAKHHDGFALFDTKASDWSIMKASPYGKDLLKPLAEACRKHGMKLGFYYSQSQDWGNPGGGTGRRPVNQGWANPDSARIDAYTLAHNGSWDPVQTSRTYTEYFRSIALPQVKELLTNYGDVAVIWWDTPMNTQTPETRELYEMVCRLQPDIIQNDRLKVPGIPGDFKTPEQKIPNLSELDGEDWETCMTMNDTWGYRYSDHNWKSSEGLLHKLIDIAAKGGNFLLNIGPKPDGSFPQESMDRLEDIGKWMKRYGTAIYGTYANPVSMPVWDGRITARDGKNATTLYLSLFSWPSDGKLVVDGLTNKAASARVFGAKSELPLKQEGGKLVISGLPASAPDKIASVIEVKLDGIASKKMLQATRDMKSGSID